MIEISTQGFDLGREIDSQGIRTVDTYSPPLRKLSISTFEPVDNSDPLNPTEFFSYEALSFDLVSDHFDAFLGDHKIHAGKLESGGNVGPAADRPSHIGALLEDDGVEISLFE